LLRTSPRARSLESGGRSLRLGTDAMAQGNAGAPGQGRVIRFDGTQEEAFPAWRMWAKAHLRTKTKTARALGRASMENEEELAAELITLSVPESPAWESIRHLADEMDALVFSRGGLAAGVGAGPDIAYTFPGLFRAHMDADARISITEMAPPGVVRVCKL